MAKNFLPWPEWLRRPTREHAIRRRLVYLLIAGIVPAILIAAAVGVQSGITEEHALKDRGWEIARSAIEIADREVANAQVILSTLATSPDLAEGRLQSFHRQATQAVKIKGETIIVFDRSGQQLVNTLRPYGEALTGRTEPAAVSAAFETGKPHVSNVFRGRLRDHQEFLVLVPVRRGETVAYVLGMAVTCETMSGILAASGVPPEWLAGIFDRNGVIVARSRDAGQYIGKPGPRELISAIGTAPNGEFGGVSWEGAAFYNRFQRSELTGWTAVVGIPQTILAAAFSQPTWTVGGGGAVLLVAGFLLATLVARRIAAPIEGLADAAYLLGAGAVPAPDHSGIGEVDRVGAALVAAGIARRGAERSLRESEGRFRDFAEAASDWFWEMDASLRFTFISERFSEVAGVPIDSLIGKSRDDLQQQPVSDAAWHDHLGDLANRRAFREFSYRLSRPDGQVRYIEVSGTPVFAADGAFRGYRGVGTDVTIEIEADLARERLEGRLRESIDALEEGFALFDAEERLILCNSRFAEIQLWDQGQPLQGQRFGDLMRISAERGMAGERQDIEAWIAERLARIRTIGTPIEVLLADGQWLRGTNYRTASGGTICLRADITDIKRAEARLLESVETLAEGFALFDGEERLVLCNTRFREIYDISPELAAPGTKIEDIIRANAVRGMHPGAITAPERWIADRMRQFRDAEGPIEQRLSDGRWLRLTDAHTPSGGTICLRADITDLKSAEQRLRESIEAMGEGFALFDADERLVLCNSRYRDMYALNKEFIVPGVSFEEIVRNGAERGGPAAAVDRVGAYIAERLARFRDPVEPFEQLRYDGRWLRHTDYHTPSGGTICLRADITDLKLVEQRLRDAINSTPDGFVLYDPDDRLVLCNHRFRDIYVYLPDSSDLTGLSFDELTRPLVERKLLAADNGDPEAWYAARKQAHQEPTDQPFLMHLRDGRWIEIHEGRTLEGGWVSVCVDMTGRKNIELALQDSETTLRNFLAASPDALLIVCERHRIVMASAKAEELFGYTQSELIGMPIESLIPVRYRARHVEHVDNYVRNPHPRDMGAGLDLWALRKDGSEFPAEISLNPCMTPQGLVSLAAIRDITARRRIDAALREAQKMEALGTLAGGIAHDLNNTLVPILGLTQIVMEGIAADAPEHELLDNILGSANRAKGLVAQILDFSRPATATRQPIDLRGAVSESTRLVRAAISPRISINTDLPVDEMTILGNETQIHQVILNLCMNAAHSIGARAGKIGIPLQVVRVDENKGRSLLLKPGRYALLSVIDDGRGMDEATRRRIFEPFFTTKEIGEGTGLGLSIVHGIVTAHGGMVNAWSQIGKGTKFEIYFPLISPDRK